MARGAWGRTMLAGVAFIDPKAVGGNPFSGEGGGNSDENILPYDPSVLQAIQDSDEFSS